MSSEIEHLLEMASLLPPADRQQFLERECGDEAIRAEVQSLLPFYTRSESWFEAPVEEMRHSVQRAPELSPGDVVGAFRILSLIRVGGMGAVYLACRVDGVFEQDVAIKAYEAKRPWSINTLA